MNRTENWRDEARPVKSVAATLPAEPGKPRRLALPAKLIRILSIPPVMVTAVVLALFYTTDTIFRSAAEAWLTIVFLAFVPVLAYPLSKLLPKIRARGREGQRDLAFYLSAAGYAAGWIYGYVTGATASLQAIFAAYLFSVTALLVFNKLLFIRASGHASSIAGPILLMAWFIGGWSIPAALALYGLIFRASVYAGRHTRAEFLLGTGLCLASTVAALLLYLL